MITRVITGTAAAGLCAAVALTGCSSSSSGSGGSTSSGPSSSTPAVSSSPAGAGSSTPAGAPSAAAKKYEGLTAPIDSDLQGFLQLPNATPVSKVKAAAAKLAKDEGTLVGALKKATWPSAVQPTITQLEKTSTAERAVYAKCASASSVAAIKKVLASDKATIAARVAAAGHVRVALGLPAAGRAASSSPPA